MTTVVAALALMTTLSSGTGAHAGMFAVAQDDAPAAQATSPSDADAIRQRVKEGQKVRVTDTALVGAVDRLRAAEARVAATAVLASRQWSSGDA